MKIPVPDHYPLGVELFAAGPEEPAERVSSGIMFRIRSPYFLLETSLGELGYEVQPRSRVADGWR